MIQFQEYLQSDYPGFASFVDTIIKPIFGDSFKPDKDYGEMVEYPEELEDFDVIENSHDENLKKQAEDSGLERILNLGTIKVQGGTRPIFVGKDKEDSTNSKRFTYLFGRDQVCKTAAQRFTNLLNKKGKIAFDDITEAFSVEKVSKEFFDNYRSIYADIVCYVTGKRIVKDGNKWVEKQECEPNEFIMQQFSRFSNPEKSVRDYVKKLMGRLVFLQFIQKKGWLGVPVDDDTWTKGDKKFIQNLFASYGDKDNFIDNVLENLFNDINNRRENDIAGQWCRFFPNNNEGFKVPYLNGGLFELDPEDSTTFPLPALFMDKILNDFFSAYNFTIDENDPSDAEVGVDPEMLGRVFENLLEDNKDKGTFYTPKEIVQFMCRESLIAYLQTGAEEESKESLRQFVTTHEVCELRPADVFKVDKKLREVKICDPAIGSGAFPMGLLKELFDCRMAIEGIEEGVTPAEIKKDIIQSSIYGVDIEKGAVDIARLRFWLSLVIDEQTPHALPNMDFKIMQGNSLLEQYEGFDLSTIMCSKKKIEGPVQMTLFEDSVDKLRHQLIALRRAYYRETDNNHKKELRQSMRDIVQLQINALSCDIDLSNIDIAENAEFFLWHTWFSDVFENGGFDIVIGNPPYFVYEGNNKSELPQLRKIKEYSISFGGKLNAYKLFLANALRFLVKKDGINCFIFQNSFMADQQAANLRNYVLNNCQILSIDSYPERDNKKKRVFENVKMSVCILLLQNSKTNKSFLVNVWDDKYKSTGISTYFTKEEIESIDSEYLTIPRLREEAKPIVLKMIDRRSIAIKCQEGELNVTSHRPFFSDDNSLPVIMKGAGIQKYYYTYDMSQGEIEYLKEKEYLERCGNSEKSHHHEFERIVMQGMTGANDKIRLVMSIVPKGMYLGHSCKYILPSMDISNKCLLGFMNSKLANFFFRCFSTNSNVNGYEIEAIPICHMTTSTSQQLEKIVDEITAKKNENHSCDICTEENLIDIIIYHLYGLTYDEVRIVDPDTTITKDEYESKR